MLDISVRLKELRRNHNYTIQFVANSIGIAVRTYQNYEYGQREISAEALFKLSDFYGVSTDYLLGRETGEPDPAQQLANKFNMSVLEKKILDNYFSLSRTTKDELMESLRKALKQAQEESKGGE